MRTDITSASLPATKLPVRLSAQQAVRLRYQPVGSAGRGEVEQQIAGHFLRVHDARVGHFLPHLLAMEQNGQMIAAAGVRRAGDSHLFLEQYLDRQVEQQLSLALGQPVCRSTIAEVGNLVAPVRGGSLLLLAVLASALDAAGLRWMVFAASREVRRILACAGFPALDLANADPSRLAGGAAEWGRYYEHAPRVMAGELARVAPALQLSPTLQSAVRQLLPSTTALQRGLRGQ